MTLPNLSALPSISFAGGNAADVEAAVISAYERLAGVTLQRADPVRLFLESLAYVICVQNNVIDLAGRQNLLAFAQGGHLDHLGALMGVSRIPAQPAHCVLRFSVGEVLAFALPIPAGTRVATQDGKISFATGLAAEIPAGELSVDVAAGACEAGLAASGLVAGQVCRLVDPLPYIVSAVNVSTTAACASASAWRPRATPWRAAPGNTRPACWRSRRTYSPCPWIRPSPAWWMCALCLRAGNCRTRTWWRWCWTT